jgi:hypothetical protein
MLDGGTVTFKSGDECLANPTPVSSGWDGDPAAERIVAGIDFALEPLPRTAVTNQFGQEPIVRRHDRSEIQYRRTNARLPERRTSRSP